MKIQITGDNIDVTDALREYVEKRLKKLFTHAESLQKTQVIFSKDHINYVADGQIHVPGTTLHAKASSEDSMYTAIDSMADKLLRQLDKHQEKMHKHRD